MIVLDLLPYDAILGYDWLKTFSPMHCNWQTKTLQFKHQGSLITLKGLQPPQSSVSTILGKKVFKSIKGNDIWAYVIIDSPTSPSPADRAAQKSSDEDIHDLLVQYADIFQNPKHLPPHRSYDHAVPLYPDAMPVNDIGPITIHHSTKLKLKSK